MKLLVLGAGAWGTALAAQASARHEVTLWARNPAIIEDMRAGRMVISGRMADVCAELDRLAALEAAQARV